MLKENAQIGQLGIDISLIHNRRILYTLFWFINFTICECYLTRKRHLPRFEPRMAGAASKDANRCTMPFKSAIMVAIWKFGPHSCLTIENFDFLFEWRERRLAKSFLPFVPGEICSWPRWALQKHAQNETQHDIINHLAETNQRAKQLWHRTYRRWSMPGCRQISLRSHLFRFARVDRFLWPTREIG